MKISTSITIASIALLFNMVHINNANAECNIFSQMKKCYCVAKFKKAGGETRNYETTIGAWASCGIQGCVAGNAPQGWSGPDFEQSTLRDSCVRK